MENQEKQQVPEGCTHECSSCGESCSFRDPKSLLEKPNALSHIKKTIAVVSGKGGVGKSMVTSQLAVALKRKGYKVGIMDADITGPSIPKAFGVKDALACEQGLLPGVSAGGIQVMSLNLLMEDESAPVIWRGPIIAGTVKQFWTDVIWEDVDYLLIDMPPGTGDVPLTVFQSIPLDGVVIVTSPQELVSMIVEKAVNMTAAMNIPVLGIIENMSYVLCPDCGKVIRVFGESHVQEVAEKHGLEVLEQVPMDGSLAAAADEGKIEEVYVPYFEQAADRIVLKLHEQEN